MRITGSHLKLAAARLADKFWALSRRRRGKRRGPRAISYWAAKDRLRKLKSKDSFLKRRAGCAVVIETRAVVYRTDRGSGGVEDGVGEKKSATAVERVTKSLA